MKTHMKKLIDCIREWSDLEVVKERRVEGEKEKDRGGEREGK